MKLPDGPEPRRLTARPRLITHLLPVVDWDTLLDQIWWFGRHGYVERLTVWLDRQFPFTQAVRRQARRTRAARESEQRYRESEKGRAKRREINRRYNRKRAARARSDRPTT